MTGLRRAALTTVSVTDESDTATVPALHGRVGDVVLAAYRYSGWAETPGRTCSEPLSPSDSLNISERHGARWAAYLLGRTRGHAVRI